LTRICLPDKLGDVTCPKCLSLLVLLLFCACQAAPPPTATAARSATDTPGPSRQSDTPASPLPTATLLPTPRPTHTPTRTPVPPPRTPTAAEPGITTLLFTGVIVPARCVQAALDANGNPDYPYEEVSSIIQESDLAVGTFNATMSHRVEHTGCVWTYQLVGSPDNADALQRAGFDVMGVATNHIKDCGLMKGWCEETFSDTLENLHRVNILTVGAGKDLAQAMQPVVVTLNGVRFAFVSLGDSKMDEVVFAAQDHPGIARLTEENIQAAVAEARKVADVVIAMPHWGSEDNTIPNWLQREQARQIVAAGADLVVGNHTHVVQAIQQIDGIPVFYGLGNFVFDQFLNDHQQGAILLVKFKGAQYLGYEMIPTHVDQDGRVHIAGEKEAAEILQRVNEASQFLR
jgi:poly-gamma-glutamate synthesis protein (capsule biosynthesis protein)